MAMNLQNRKFGFLDSHQNVTNGDNIVLLGNTIGMAGFILLGLTTLNPAVGTLFIGLQYSFINAALYPSVSFFLKDNFEGTGYSLIAAFINLSSTGKLDLYLNIAFLKMENSRSGPILGWLFAN